ncbi:hypothetical protein Y032_0098g3090 [Ancylostoma ceylanicum]|uniref:Uncharacterized protein n=1 Tax=Ancylostoma ceylanicum TaxID=53326 RepID=A0A016TJ74_9BILA|nr:hypothetical protein Y032_0098g3090 [Ancylostoma ceylanicum]
MEINDITDILNKLFTNKALFPRSVFLAKGTDDTIPLTWELSLHIQVLNSDGFVPDAVVCASSAALSNVRLPKVTLAHAKEDESPIQREEITVSKETLPLDLTTFPVALTFYLFRNSKGDKVLVDPPRELVQQCATKVSMVIDSKDVLLLRTRGVIKDDQLLSSMIALAERRHQSIMDSGCIVCQYFRRRMSTEVEDILKNAQTAEFKQSMFEEDLENLSLLEDSRDSYAFNTTLDDSQPGYAVVSSFRGA